MPRIKLKIIWIAHFWTDSRCWACVQLMRWCLAGTAYPRTERIIAVWKWRSLFIWNSCCLKLLQEIEPFASLWGDTDNVCRPGEVGVKVQTGCPLAASKHTCHLHCYRLHWNSRKLLNFACVTCLLICSLMSPSGTALDSVLSFVVYRHTFAFGVPAPIRQLSCS